MKLLNLKELSQHTSLSVYMHRKHARMGMPHYRVGRKILVDPEEFETWFKQFKAGSSQAPGSLDSLVDETIGKTR